MGRLDGNKCQAYKSYPILDTTCNMKAPAMCIALYWCDLYVIIREYGESIGEYACH